MGSPTSVITELNAVRGLLVIERGVRNLVSIPLDRNAYLLGKSTTADVVLDNPYISREHAQVFVDKGRFRIRDLGSTNGTFVNGVRVESESQPLQSGDHIELSNGQVVLRFQEEAGGTLVLDAVPAATDPEPPARRHDIVPEGTVTIMFSDILDSTAMTERLGDQKAQQVLHAHNAVVRQQLAVHGGFEVKHQGDGFMLAFPSARRALQCALGVQRALAEYCKRHPESLIHVRVGLHTGEVIREGNDFFGKNVIMAARIADNAGGGEVLVSSILKQLTESSGDIEFDEGRDVELKGLSGTQRVYAIRWK